MKPFSFPKYERLLNRRDFVNLNRIGRRRHTEHFVIIFSQNGRDVTRLGITASKKTGNAVTRNRIKRHIREFFRHSKSQIPTGYDIVIVAKQKAGTLDFRKIKEELGESLLDKAFYI